jgi:hypothetical protein
MFTHNQTAEVRKIVMQTFMHILAVRTVHFVEFYYINIIKYIIIKFIHMFVHFITHELTVSHIFLYYLNYMRFRKIK